MGHGGGLGSRPQNDREIFTIILLIVHTQRRSYLRAGERCASGEEDGRKGLLFAPDGITPDGHRYSGKGGRSATQMRMEGEKGRPGKIRLRRDG